jgi:hypothetical protein
MMPKLTYQEAAEIVEANEAAVSSTYTHELTENHQFAEKPYWQLLGAIQVIAEERYEESVLHKPVVKSIFVIQNIFLRHLIYHFDDQDEYQINNLPPNFPMHLDSFTNLINLLTSSDQ